MKPVRIVILAKAPLPGFAKTRLISALGEQGAAQLAERLLRLGDGLWSEGHTQVLA